MTDAQLQAALDYIYSLIDYEVQRRPRDAANYDLRRVEDLLTRLGSPHKRVKSVHIAGSKGKGSTSAMIASALAASGYTTGLYTSPHLLNFNERVRVNGQEIPDEAIVRLVDCLKPQVEAVNRRAAYGKLTTFEVITALGFLYFAERRCDINVVEVGLGGRLDATNVIVPEACAITSISLEHTDVLGNTLEAIAGEKAGIIKPGITVVTSPQAEEVNRVFENACRLAGANLLRAGRDITWQSLGYNDSEQSLLVRGRLGEYRLTIPLLGEYQLENAALAVGVLECLMERGFAIPSSRISEGFSKVSWPGRLQVLRRKPYVVADGAHNPYSAGKLREALKKFFRFSRGTLIIGTSSDKDISGIVSELKPVFNRVIVTRSIHPRALAPDKLAAEFNRQGVKTEVSGDISTALPLALDGAGEEDLVCVTGSLFVVAGAIDQARILGW